MVNLPRVHTCSLDAFWLGTGDLGLALAAYDLEIPHDQRSIVVGAGDATLSLSMAVFSWVGLKGGPDKQNGDRSRLGDGFEASSNSVGAGPGKRHRK